MSAISENVANLKFNKRVSNDPNYIQQADEYVKWLQETKDQYPDAANNIFKEFITPEEGNLQLSKSPYIDFIQQGDYHYFVSRVLFMHQVVDYSNFSAHQCIENYLKGYLKFLNCSFKTTHNLDSLLQKCKENALDSHLFIFSNRAKLIIDRFDPFYELARYPVQLRSRPKRGFFSYIFPLDISVLDYFVFRMREIFPKLLDGWDIFTTGHYKLFQCQQHHPEFYSNFIKGNINFKQSL